MVMWNVVGMVAKHSANALGRFAASDAGKKTGQALSSAARSVRDATTSAAARLEESRVQRATVDATIVGGDRVRLSDGATGQVVRYLYKNELPMADPSATGLSPLVLLEMDAPTSPMERHLVIAASSCTKI